MRLLDRYLLRALLAPLAYCLGGLVLFWVSSDLITDLDTFHQEQLTAWDLTQYYVVRLPELLVLQYVLPVALLLALLYALTDFARHQELTAVRAAGVSLWRICLPYFAVGLALTPAVYFLNECLAPRGMEIAQQIRKRHVAGGAGMDDPRWIPDLKFRNDRAERFWRIRAYNVQTSEMRDPYVEWKRPDGTRREVIAARAERADGVWTFYQGRLVDPDPHATNSIQLFEALSLPELAETPDQIRSEQKIGQLSSIKAARKAQLTLAEILDYRWLHPELRPRDRALLDTKLHARLATPWTCLVVVLIAIPFGARSGRRNVFIGVASGIFICFGYFVLQQVGTALGIGGFVLPLLAGWLPNGLFGAVGLWLIARVR